jgi:aspartate/methionine/tyrosine aminotransferase
MKKLSSITELFTESVIREMTRISDSVGGINLSQGFPDFESPDEIKAAACDAIQKGYNQYPVTFGEPDLRDAISCKALWYNKIICNSDTDITVTCGATEAMIASLKAIINPGEEVIIFEPFYENYGADTILSGAIPRYVQLNPPNWDFDINELRRTFNTRTKAIIINTPNNPTGKVFSKNELEVIAELCMKWDSIAITDEIYEHIIYDQIEHISIASIPEMRNRTITINSISKTYSVTGWRIGWAIASPEITSRIRKVHDFLTVGAPMPFQIAATKALNFPSEYYISLRERYSKLRSIMYTILRKNGFKVILPNGAYYMFAKYSELLNIIPSKSDFDFSTNLLEETGVATVPGSSFYSSGSNSEYVRFAFCKKTETLNNVDRNFSNRLNK